MRQTPHGNHNIQFNDNKKYFFRFSVMNNIKIFVIFVPAPNYQCQLHLEMSLSAAEKMESKLSLSYDCLFATAPKPVQVYLNEVKIVQTVIDRHHE